MKRLIYTKYSNERNRKFAIRTDILQDDTGQRFVRKVPLYQEGIAHIKNLSEIYYKLEKIYEGSGFVCNKCWLQGEELWLEYIDAITLEEQLDDLIADGKIEKAWEMFSGYLCRIRNINSQEPFRMTEAFQNVFGPVDFSQDSMSASVSDIDLVCNNILLRKSDWVILDYEWSFEFPVPVGYLLFRIIHYYIETQEMRQSLNQYCPYEWAGITEDDKKIYMNMEQKFQKFLTAGHVPMREMYGEISPGVYPVKHLVKKEEIRCGEERLQVFYSFGEGFEQRNSQYYRMPEGFLKIRLEIPENAQELRLDPGDAPGICKIYDMKYDSGEVHVTSISEGMEPYENGYLMNCFDPQIYLGKIPKEAKWLDLELQIIPAEPESVEICTANYRLRKELEGHYQRENERILEENRKQKQRLQKLEEQFDAQKQKMEEQARQIQEQTHLISQMRGTKIWRLYEKYRKTVERK